MWRSISRPAVPTIALAQRIDDGAVLVIGGAHRARQHQATPAEQMQLGLQGGKQLDQLRIVGAGDQLPVHLVVERIEGGDVEGIDRLVHARHKLVEHGELLGADDGGGEPAGGGEQPGAHVVNVDGFLGADLADEEPAIELAAQQAELLQRAAGLAHRAAAHAELERQRALIDAGAAVQLAAADQPLDLVLDHRHERRRAGRAGGSAGGGLGHGPFVPPEQTTVNTIGTKAALSGQTAK